jgi:GNAT superfamily N-acetyltransferase
VDATLLHAVEIGAADFLVTQDRGLHDRARRRSTELARRVLFIPDAVQLLRTTYEPVEAPIRYVDEVSAHTIPIEDTIFDSLREGYPAFNDWWKNKCVKERRACWVVEDEGIAGLVVRKDETGANTDASQKFGKILKICAFKVRPEKRGIKIGELLLKKVFWFAQRNYYDLVYITTFEDQFSLIDLLEYYGFVSSGMNANGERVYEKIFSHEKLTAPEDQSLFDAHRLNYPRFVTEPNVEAFGIPIRESYHDTLYPDLRDHPQLDLFESAQMVGGPRRPGNTIRKVYLCRAPSNLGPPGSLLFFYKGLSQNPPSQAMTAVGVLEDVLLARSTTDLVHMTGGRSVYSERALINWDASPARPVKVINYLLAAYIEPPIALRVLMKLGVVRSHPPQSTYRINEPAVQTLLSKAKLAFAT